MVQDIFHSNGSSSGLRTHAGKRVWGVVRSPNFWRHVLLQQLQGKGKTASSFLAYHCNRHIHRVPAHTYDFPKSHRSLPWKQQQRVRCKYYKANSYSIQEPISLEYIYWGQHRMTYCAYYIRNLLDTCSNFRQYILLLVLVLAFMLPALPLVQQQ